MSLVTSAIWYDSRRCLHRASTRAVLPEPTGPATPTRRGWVFIVLPLPWEVSSGAKEPTVKVLVPRAGDALGGGGRTYLFIGQHEAALHRGRDRLHRSSQDPLTGALAERHHTNRRSHLAFDARERVAESGGRRLDFEMRGRQREKAKMSGLRLVDPGSRRGNAERSKHARQRSTEIRLFRAKLARGAHRPQPIVVSPHRAVVLPHPGAVQSRQERHLDP